MRAILSEVHPVLMVRDVMAAIAFYEQLGFAHLFSDEPSRPMYAGVRRDAVELHLQWHDAAEWSDARDRPVYRIVVEDVDRLSDELDALPGLDRTRVAETGWGTREFHLRDPDGNGLQFYRDL